MNETFERMMQVIQDDLTTAGMAPSRAAEISARAADRLAREVGGHSVYIPRRAPWFDRAARDRAIRASFDGRNIAELCARFGVSRRTVYRLIKK